MSTPLSDDDRAPGPRPAVTNEVPSKASNAVQRRADRGPAGRRSVFPTRFEDWDRIVRERPYGPGWAA